MKLKAYIYFGLAALIAVYTIAGIATGRIDADLGDFDPQVVVSVIPAAIGMAVHLRLLNKALDDLQRESTDQGRVLVLDDWLVTQWTARGAYLGAASALAGLLIGELFTVGRIDATDLVAGVLLFAPAFAVGAAVSTHRYLRIVERSIQSDQRSAGCGVS